MTRIRHESSGRIRSLGLLAVAVVAAAVLERNLVFGRSPDPQPCACGNAPCASVGVRRSRRICQSGSRLAHVPVYRLRVDDKLRCVYRLTRKETNRPYLLNVGDEVSVESFTDPALNRPSLIVQPDGTITLRLLGQVKAGHLTMVQLRDELEKAYTKFYKTPR